MSHQRLDGTPSIFADREAVFPIDVILAEPSHEATGDQNSRLLQVFAPLVDAAYPSSNFFLANIFRVAHESCVWSQQMRCSSVSTAMPAKNL